MSAIAEMGQSLHIVTRRKPPYVCNAPDSDRIQLRSGMSRSAIMRRREAAELRRFHLQNQTSDTSVIMSVMWPGAEVVQCVL
jgi:hypothetical protein